MLRNKETKKKVEVFKHAKPERTASLDGKINLVMSCGNKLLASAKGKKA
jgi:hypothetical protein